MLLIHLDLPLRNVQVRRLDSGEGDSRAWDPATGRWKIAAGRLSGYWERVGVKNPRRGVFREIQTLHRRSDHRLLGQQQQDSG